jgi:hypothetical protein
MPISSRDSLYYPATYLSLTGMSLVIAPSWTLGILFSNGQYDGVFVRFVGMCMVALSVLVIQIIRYRLEVLHRTLVFIRVLFIASITWFYFSTWDPVFLVIIGVVGLGVLATTTALILERRRE